MDNKMNNDSKENNGKGIAQTTVDYGNAMTFETLDGSQILNEVITDTYVTQNGNEDEMLKTLDKMTEYMRGKSGGVAGYLSYCYARFTMMFLIEQYELSKRILKEAEMALDAAEKYAMTGNFLDENGKETRFRNYSFGEPESDMPATLQFAKDCYDTARLVHKKAGSFESGYSFIVASMLYHFAIDESKLALDDCKHMRKLIAHIEEYVDKIIKNPPKSNIGDDGKTYSDVKDVEKSAKRGKTLHFGSLEELGQAISESANSKSVMLQIQNCEGAPKD